MEIHLPDIGTKNLVQIHPQKLSQKQLHFVEKTLFADQKIIKLTAGFCRGSSFHLLDVFWISFGCRVDAFLISLRFLDGHNKYQELALLLVTKEKSAKSTYTSKTCCFQYHIYIYIYKDGIETSWKNCAILWNLIHLDRS